MGVFGCSDVIEPKECCLISGICHSVHGVCTLLGFYAAYNGGFLQMFWDNPSASSSGVKLHLIFGNGADRLSQNVDKKLSFCIA